MRRLLLGGKSDKIELRFKTEYIYDYLSLWAGHLSVQGKIKDV